MIRVFIAMPYGDDNSLEVRQKNTRKAMAVWHELTNMGFTAYCPHLSHYLHEYAPRDREEWLSISKEWLDVCDCVIAFGTSEGVESEVDYAHLNNKPVFGTFGDLAWSYGMSEE